MLPTVTHPTQPRIVSRPALRLVPRPPSSYMLMPKRRPSAPVALKCPKPSPEPAADTPLPVPFSAYYALVSAVVGTLLFACFLVGTVITLPSSKLTVLLIFGLGFLYQAFHLQRCTHLKLRYQRRLIRSVLSDNRTP